MKMRKKNGKGETAGETSQKEKSYNMQKETLLHAGTLSVRQTWSKLPLPTSLYVLQIPTLWNQ